MNKYTVMKKPEVKEMVGTHIRMPKELWKRAKIAAAKAERSLADIVTEALERYLDEVGA
jgi:predicted DNA-binding protein